MTPSPTAADPRHYTTRDGRTLPVTGTHDDETCIKTFPSGSGFALCNHKRDNIIHYAKYGAFWHKFETPCMTCQPEPARVLAETFRLGQLVVWPYGHHGEGRAHGRVIALGNTRVQVFWHSSNRPRPIWKRAKDLAAFGAKSDRCATCREGK